MSKRLEISLENTRAALIASESAILGLSEEEYLIQAADEKLVRDKVNRAREDERELTIDEAFDPIIENRKAMTDNI